MQGIINYLENPIWVSSSRQEKLAFLLLKPARFLFAYFNAYPHYETKKLTNKKIEYVPASNQLITGNDTPLNGYQKIFHLFYLTFNFAAALPLTPIGLLYHHIALRKSEEVKEAYAEMEEWNKFPLLIAAKKGEWETLLKKSELNIEEGGHLFFEELFSNLSIYLAILLNPLKHPKKIELLRKLIFLCPQESLDILYLEKSDNIPCLLKMAIEDKEMALLKVLIERCPKTCMKSFFSLPFLGEGDTLASWSIQNGHLELLNLLIKKYHGDKETFFKQAVQGKPLVDLALNKITGRYSFVQALLNACPAEHIDLLFSPQTNPEATMKELFQQRIEQALYENLEGLKNCLLRIQSDGDTLLHRYHQRHLFEKYLNILNIDCSALYNHEGLSVADIISHELDPHWIRKVKSFSLHEEIPLKEYPKRFLSLKNNVLQLWESLRFGKKENEINPQLLSLKIYRNHIQETPEGIKSFLTEILKKIELKTVWTGTPEADEPDNLHAFYSEMLCNFETVATYLTTSNQPELTAGYLIDIAKVRIEGRCAMAYQEEIEQKADLCSSESMCLTIEKQFERSACKALKLLIEVFLKKTTGAIDVHDSRSARYACGLVKTADPMDQRKAGFAERVVQLREKIAASFDLKNFLQVLSVSIEKDTAIDCVKDLVPSIKPYSIAEKSSKFLNKLFLRPKPKSTRDLYRKAIIKAKEKEEALKNETIKAIQKITRSKSTAILEAIQHVKTIALPKVIPGKNLIETLIAEENQQLKELTDHEDLDIAHFFNAHYSNSNDVEEMAIALLKAHQKYPLPVRMKIQGQLGARLEKRIGTAREFERAVLVNTHKERALEIAVSIQKNYRASLLKIVEDLNKQQENEDLDLTFDQNNFLFPSQAIENNYKKWESQEDLPYKQRMLLKLLLNAKILRKKPDQPLK